MAAVIVAMVLRRARYDRRQAASPSAEQVKRMYEMMQRMPCVPFCVDPTSHVYVLDNYMREALEAAFPKPQVVPRCTLGALPQLSVLIK